MLSDYIYSSSRIRFMGLFCGVICHPGSAMLSIHQPFCHVAISLTVFIGSTVFIACLLFRCHVIGLMT